MKNRSPVIDDKGKAYFGGSNEEGTSCSKCERRSLTPFCPWCGMQKDDAPTSLLAFLDRMAARMQSEADTRTKNRAAGRDKYGNERDDQFLERTARTIACKQETADRYATWAAWVRKAMG